MILVTGGTGLVGAHLLYQLVSNNQDVKAIYRDKKSLKKTERIFSYYTTNHKALFKKITWVKANLTNLPNLTLAFNKVTHVYHCAAYITFNPRSFNTLKKINIEGTANIVNLCLAYNIKKLCYVSSIATLGTTIKDTPVTERNVWNPETDNNVYAISKYGAEMEVWRATQEGLDAVIVNPGVIIGPGNWNSGTGKLFKEAYKGINYYTAGNIALVDVNDVVAVMVLLLNSTIKNQRFIVVGKNETYKTFTKILCNAVNSKAPKKEATPFLLSIACVLDWIKSTVTRTPRRITKQISSALLSQKTYSNKAVKEALNYNFKNTEDAIINTGKIFLKKDL